MSNQRVIGTRFSPDELAAIEAAAIKAHISPHQFRRIAVLAMAGVSALPKQMIALLKRLDRTKP